MVIKGRVQGVFFRASTREEAARLNLAGWVRNLSNGNVEVVAEGERAALEKLVEWSHQGPPYAEVTHVETNEGPFTGEFKTFQVR